MLTLDGPPLRVALAAVTLSAASIGWMAGRLGTLALGAVAVLLVPLIWTDAAGIALAAAVVAPRLAARRLPSASVAAQE